MKLKLKGKDKPSSTGRQRHLPEEAEQSLASQKSYSYSSRRSEDSFNVGRGNSQAQKNKLARTTSFGVKRFGLIILFLAILVSGIKVLSLSSVPVVHIVEVSNNAITAKTGAAVYKEAASKYLSSSIWNSNKVTLDSDGLTAYLTDHYPELSSVSISIPFVDNHLVIYLNPTQPIVILVEPTSAYALDSNGRAILTASNAADLKLNLPVITDQSGLSVDLGKMALTSSDIYFVQEVVGQLKAKGYMVSHMTLPANSDELDVSLTGEPYFIKFNLKENDPRQQAGTFLATIANLKSQNITPLKYVDVRVDGRAYYQ